MTTKYDVRRELKKWYSPKNHTSAAYRRAVEALYAVAYTVKFASKGDLGKDFVVGPLEGLWWADDMDDFLARFKDNWQWRLLINVPDWIADDMVEDAKHTALAKKNLPAIPDVRSETLNEGTSAQVLHIGPYDDETPTLSRLHHEYLPANNLRGAGLHHEIYLSDPRKTDPAKLKTILRQPVEAHSG